MPWPATSATSPTAASNWSPRAIRPRWSASSRRWPRRWRLTSRGLANTTRPQRATAGSPSVPDAVSFRTRSLPRGAYQRDVNWPHDDSILRPHDGGFADVPGPAPGRPTVAGGPGPGHVAFAPQAAGGLGRGAARRVGRGRPIDASDLLQ